mgnify:CR=1 FL=1
MIDSAKQDRDSLVGTHPAGLFLYPDKELKHMLFTSEQVSAGHPDKICDQISDAIVDRFLDQDPYAAIRAECAVASGVLFLVSRFASKAAVDITQVARKVIRKAGYEDVDFNSKTCSILTSIKELPTDEAARFDAASLSDEQIEAIHVQQQGTFFGYACNQSVSLMPLPIHLAHKLAMQIDMLREQRILPCLAPDGKTQVSVEYVDLKPIRIHSVSVCVSLSQAQSSSRDPRGLKEDIREAVVMPALQNEPVQVDERTKFFLNPEGVHMVGGTLGALLTGVFASTIINSAIPALTLSPDSAGGLLYGNAALMWNCLLYTSPSPRDRTRSRMPSSA